MDQRALTLSPAWRDWLAENLLRGISPIRLKETLAAHGVPDAEADRNLAELASSPVVRVGRAYATQAERLSRVVALGRTVERLAPSPSNVERIDTIDADGLYRRYVATGTPVVVEGLARDWPAVRRWTPALFAERFGDVEITMTAEREQDPYYDARTAEHSRSIRMADYVRLVEDASEETNDFYLVAQNRNLENDGLEALYDDVFFPDGFLDMSRRRGGSALWFGPAGTVTPMHHDCSNILFTQIYGKKRIRMVSPYEDRLFDGALSMYAMRDPADLDDSLVKVVDLSPGDTLFIPVGYWHEVRASTVSISLAFSNFVRDANFDWYRPGDVK